MDAQAAAQQLIDNLIESGQEAGIQVAAYLRGEQVVSASAGLADGDPDVGARPVDERTLF